MVILNFSERYWLYLSNSLYIMKKRHPIKQIKENICNAVLHCHTLNRDRHKNHNIICILTLLCSLACSIETVGQTIKFSYDDAGNRISKSILFSMTRAYGGNADFSDDTSITSDVFLSYSDDILTIFVPNLADEVSYDITISTLGGQVIRKETVNKELHKINTRKYISGMYIVCLTYNGEKRSWKFTKE